MITYDGLPVFAPEVQHGANNSIANKFVILGEVQSARSQFVTKTNRMGYSFSMYQDTRADREAIITFFKQQQGKYLPFWYIEPVTINTITKVESTTIFYLKDLSRSYMQDRKIVRFYIKELDVVVQISSIRKVFDITLGKLEEYTIIPGDGVNIEAGHSIQLITQVRFDIDTLKIDADDLDTSSTSIKLIEVLEK